MRDIGRAAGTSRSESLRVVSQQSIGDTREKQPDNKPIFIIYYVKSIDRFGKTASDYPAKIAPEGQKAAVFNHLRRHKSNTAPDILDYFCRVGGFVIASEKSADLNGSTSQ